MQRNKAMIILENGFIFNNYEFKGLENGYVTLAATNYSLDGSDQTEEALIVEPFQQYLLRIKKQNPQVPVYIRHPQNPNQLIQVG